MLSTLEEKFRSHFVKLPKQAEKSPTSVPNLVPVHNFITIFHRKLPWVAVAQSAILVSQLRVSSDMKGRTGESVQAAGKPK